MNEENMSIETSVEDMLKKAIFNLNAEKKSRWGSDNREIKNIEFSNEMPLLIEGGPLDSLDLISVVMDVEMQIEATYGKYISLTDEDAIDGHENPFLNMTTLSSYICNNIKSNISG